MAARSEAEAIGLGFMFQKPRPLGGVIHFEAGLAMGLGRPVIWTCRKDDFENTHFDTRQYNHIVWETPEDLREKLADRIRATIPWAKAS